MDVGPCQCVNPLGSLGETSEVALQWSGRNSMALLVGVHGGAPFV